MNIDREVYAINQNLGAIVAKIKKAHPVLLRTHIHDNYDHVVQFAKETGRPLTSVYRQLEKDAMWYDNTIYLKEVRQTKKGDKDD